MHTNLYTVFVPPTRMTFHFLCSLQTKNSDGDPFLSLRWEVGYRPSKDLWSHNPLSIIPTYF